MRENLLLGAFTRASSEIAGLSQRVEDLFPILKDRADQRSGTLSGGEQQTVWLSGGP